MLERVTEAAFGQRRKMLRQSLKGLPGAIDALERLGERPGDWRIDILGSDISRAVVAQAREAIYGGPGLNAFRRMPERFACHFEPHGSRMRLTGGVAALARFRQHNLMDERWSLGEPFDIVFCRNVMIYFDAETQRRVLERMHGVMKPGGLLFAGHSENFSDATELFRLRGKTIYERV